MSLMKLEYNHIYDHTIKKAKTQKEENNLYFKILTIK